MAITIEPYTLSESDASLIAMALRAKANQDADTETGISSLDETFQRQAKQARKLAELFECADLVSLECLDDDGEAIAFPDDVLEG